MENVSIVLVSHSKKLVDGLLELLDQLVQGKVYITTAAGSGEALGTDATLVMRALESCPAGTEIVVLFDLGSALLSCEVALELLGEPFSTRTTLIDAPLVEGAIAAAVDASLGHARESVVSSAVSAWNLRKIVD